MLPGLWIKGLRNHLSSLAAMCDSQAAAEETRLTKEDRDFLKYRISALVDYIDKKLKQYENSRTG